MGRHERRLHRQIDAISRAVPGMRDPVRSLVAGRLRLVRLPLGMVFVVGGFAGFLPVLGFWMLPLGLLLLAVDLPALRPSVNAGAIRVRQWIRRWRRRRAGEAEPKR
jgi:hypothetical protein